LPEGSKIMRHGLKLLVCGFLFLFPYSGNVKAADLNQVFQSVQSEISGERARNYTMRMWLHDKWSTLPEWKKAVLEAQTIMKERGFDQTEIIEVPADGKTMTAAWTNPIGWDAKDGTLEVIEPKVPDEFRYLCNYRDNPTSLNCWSAPTPPGGIETELVLMETSSPDELAKLNASGKIVLTSGGTRAMKRYMDKYGILGFVGDYIESNNVDFINANQWLNGWNDMPGGWWLSSYDSQKNFGFSISRKKADYLRDILRRGQKVVVRAKIDSRYYTNDTYPSITGVVKGSGPEGEEVIILGHINEWGANDNATGASVMMEAVGTLNDLIKSGKLPRPKRSLRVLMGGEMYGTLPYAVKYLQKLRDKTVVSVCVDTGAENFDTLASSIYVGLNPNACPSFTDAVLPEIIRMYYAAYNPNRTLQTMPYSMGTDTYFAEPMIGVPNNIISISEAGHLHHNSNDTIEKVDPRTLRELSFLNAVYLYYMADAGAEAVPWIANLTFSRGMQVIQETTREAQGKIISAKDDASLGKTLSEGTERIEYYTGLQKQALVSIERIVSANGKTGVRQYVARYQQALDETGKSMTRLVRDSAQNKAKSESMALVAPVRQEGAWGKEAATIIPKRAYIGTLFFAEIPPSQWKEVKSSPHFWEASNWAASSYWWCDGKRNLNEVKKLCELEAGISIENFDLINYFKFLKDYKYVEFVR
jgi:hypothetical protein